MKAFMLLKMAVKARHDGFYSEVFKIAQYTSTRGMLLDRSVVEPPLHWNRHESMVDNGMNVADMAWETFDKNYSGGGTLQT